jgi:hypothetical protein
MPAWAVGAWREGAWKGTAWASQPPPEPPVVEEEVAVGGGGKPWKQKWRQQLVDAMHEAEQAKPAPRATKRAVERAVEVLEAIPEDSEAIEALRVEVERLAHYRYIPKAHVVELRRTLAEAWLRAIEEDDEDVFLLLH